MKHRPLLLALLVPALAFTLWLWWRDGRPQPVVDAPAGMFECVSYSPAVRTGDPLAIIDRERIRSDLELLATRFRCVRTYTVSEGVGAVPAIARELGLRVLLGLWIGRDAPQNQREIREGLQLAAEYKDVIDAIIVGNEVLLRRELTAGRLAELIAQVDEGTDLPVTYADVWDFWEENPGLAAVVDMITIHLLPYWENNPTNIDAAVRHSVRVYQDAHTVFPDKPVFIGEVGWPSRGRQREDARPSLVNQARFVRELASWAQENQIRYSLFEAFDQPWKRAQEGTVGGFWGVLDKNGEPKFGMTGPVVEDPQWKRGFLGAAAGALLFLLLGLASSSRRHASGLALMVLGGVLAGAVALLQWRYAVAASRTTSEWMGAVVLSLLGWGVYLRLLFVATSREGHELPVPAGLAELLGSLGLGREKLRGRERGLGLLRFGLLLGLAYHVLGLAFDPRYRDFPLSFYALPAASLVLMALRMNPARRTNLRLHAEEGVLAGLVGVGAVVMAIREGLLNGPALSFAAVSGLLAFSVFWTARGLAADHQGGQQHADDH